MEAYSPLKDKGERIIAAKLIVYPSDREKYFTFITTESYEAIKEWMNLF
jgi:hypothetical protein